jgi:RNA polymerase sigma-70 factor, ECF subfamily
MDLEPLIAHFRGPLVGFLCGLGNDRQRAVELAQDTFAEAYLSRERFASEVEDTAAVGRWLRGIAHNVHRARWRRDRGPGTPVSSERIDDVPAAAADPQEPAPIAAALERLRVPWRTVLQMRYLEGSGLAEIAAVLGLSVRAVEGRLRRARRELKALVEAEGRRLTAEESR